MRLGDSGATALCKHLAEHIRLLDVNLAKNRLTDLSAGTIAELMMSNYNLQSLNLHWNALTYCCVGNW